MTVRRMDAAVELTGMYSQRVMTSLPRPDGGRGDLYNLWMV